MTRAVLLSLALLATAPAALPAQAATASEELTVCLLRNTSDDERMLLTQWIFAAVSQHPKVEAYSRMPKEEAERLNREIGALFTDLLVKRCRDETQKAYAVDGEKALNAGFETLGRVAMEGLMSDPKVSGYVADMAKSTDFEAVGKMLEDAK